MFGTLLFFSTCYALQPRTYDLVIGSKYCLHRFDNNKLLNLRPRIRWFVIFPTAVSVNLHVLDLAVFNSMGKIEWDNEQTPPKALLPGWQQRYDEENKEIAKAPIPDEFAFLSLNPKIVKNPKISKIHGTGRLRSIHMGRVGRIRSPYSDAILGSYAAYISRAAFDHNFASHLSASSESAISAVKTGEKAQ